MTDAANEAPKADLLSPEDRAWMEKSIKPMFHPVIERYGVVTFQTVMAAGQIGFALSVLQQNIQHFHSKHLRAKQAQAIAVLLKLTNDMSVKVLRDNGVSKELFQSCKEDVERIGQLADDTPGEGGSRLILPS